MPAGAVAHALDELGRRARRGRRWPTASRTTPTSPSTAVWEDPADDEANVAWATDRMREMEPLASGHPARRREPRPAAGALRQRREPGPPRRDPRALRPRRPLPSLDGPALSDRVSAADLAGTCRGRSRPPPGGRWRRSTRPDRRRRKRCACGELDRLLDPAPLAAETGWCTLPDGVGYVAVRTAMPAVSAEMVDWWFDWHPRDPMRYRVWHPQAHERQLRRPAAPRAGAKAHWGAVHHPVEDVGTGTVHARIAFVRADRARASRATRLDDPRGGDDRLRLGRRRQPPGAPHA